MCCVPKHSLESVLRLWSSRGKERGQIRISEAGCVSVPLGLTPENPVQAEERLFAASEITAGLRLDRNSGLNKSSEALTIKISNIQPPLETNSCIRLSCYCFRRGKSRQAIEGRLRIDGTPAVSRPET